MDRDHLAARPVGGMFPAANKAQRSEPLRQEMSGLPVVWVVTVALQGALLQVIACYSIRTRNWMLKLGTLLPTVGFIKPVGLMR